MTDDTLIPDEATALALADQFGIPLIERMAPKNRALVLRASTAMVRLDKRQKECVEAVAQRIQQVTDESNTAAKLVLEFTEPFRNADGDLISGLSRSEVKEAAKAQARDLARVVEHEQHGGAALFARKTTKSLLTTHFSILDTILDHLKVQGLDVVRAQHDTLAGRLDVAEQAEAERGRTIQTERARIAKLTEQVNELT